MNSLRLLSTLICVTGFATQSVAQDSATVDVTATIIAGETQSRVTGNAALEFGDVSIPGRADTVCGYDIGFDGGVSIFENGVGASGNASEDGCSFLNTAQSRASFTVGCDLFGAPSLSYAVQMVSADPAISISTDEAKAEINGDISYVFDGVCNADNALEIRLGGDLRITGEAVPTNTDATLATITLEATF